MKLNLAKELRVLKGMTVTELRGKYLEVYGEETRSNSKDFLWKRIAWRMQANAHGDLSERARVRAEELADDADLRVRAPKGTFDPVPSPAPDRTVTRKLPPSSGRRLPMPGAILAREYRGETVQVKVLDDGFEYEDEVYRSLTAVAKAITGSHWNGYHFFGLKKNGG